MLMNLTTIASVVIWYEPQIDYLANLDSYSSYVGHTYIIDNSSKSHEEWVVSKRAVTYVWLGGNHGIARALNSGCKLAYDAGFQFVLTMDQDSVFDSDVVNTYLEEANVAFNDKVLAMVGVTFQGSGIQPYNGYVERNSVITSGSLLRLSSWSSIGGFEEKLFIDQVDHEFCYRLKRNGYHIFIDTNITLCHQVGSPLRKKILGYTVLTTNHPWVRRYYQVRNSLYLRHKYPEYAKPFPTYLYDLLYHCLGIILVERGSGKKIKAVLYGIWDFFRGRYGAWEEHYQ